MNNSDVKKTLWKKVKEEVKKKTVLFFQVCEDHMTLFSIRDVIIIIIIIYVKARRIV